MKKAFLGFVLMALLSEGFAQSNIVATGGEATGNGGSVSFSVGQIAVQSNGDGTTSISEGVQQPYEISVSGVDNYPNITLNAVVYPNPTQGNLQLTMNNVQLNGEVRAYDANGKYLFNKKIEGETTFFDLSDYAPGTYYLNLFSGKQMLKSFKVVKTSR